MVFQEGAPIVLWGFVAPGTLVRVSMTNGHAGSATGDSSGQWRVSLPAASASSQAFNISVQAGGAAATLTNVLVGTVLIVSGQSNLSGATTPLSFCFNASASAAEADSMPQVRLFSVGERATQGLLPEQAQLGYDPVLPWSVASSAAALQFSCLGWMTAKAMAQQLGPEQPLGFIESAWSGTCIQGWLPAAALAACGPVPQAQGWQTNSTLYNQMLAPFAQGMSVAGFVWMQGESNAIFFQEGYYDCALPALMASWRAAFHAPEGWWGEAQLAPWAGYSTTPAAASSIRAAQSSVALRDPHATLAASIDLGDSSSPKTSIHNRPKQALGARLAAGALLQLFGLGSAESSTGPVFLSASAGGPGLPPASCSATVAFAPPFQAPGSLQLANESSWPGVLNASACPPLSGVDCAGFALQCSSGSSAGAGSSSWWPAQAQLSADASALLLLAPAAPQGSAAVATSYGQGVWPLASLFAGQGMGGLPAFPWAAAAVEAAAA
jgi:hypothetical protein